MRCQKPEDLAGFLRTARQRQGLSQRRLAVRAGTSQDAISRIERGVEEPSLERFAQLMLVLGSRPVLTVEPLASPTPSVELATAAKLSPGERLREASSWNLMAGRLAEAGEQARREGHPATQRSDRR
jgi:transcriptional regulator with XRE-family HTH domain